MSDDYNGDTRPQGNAFDIGAFEYPHGITLGDVLTVLQICAGYQVDISGSPVTEINGDDRIGIREAIHALQIVARLTY